MNGAVTDLNSMLFESIDRKLATILFDLQGHVVRVNENFAQAMEYDAKELIGVHHRIFCLPEFTQSPAYSAFWDELRSGKTFQDKIERVTKNGRVIILEATYLPVTNDEGRLQYVMKVATDITERETIVKNSTAELMAMVEEMTSSTEAILAASQTVAEEMNSLHQESESVRGAIEHIHSVVAFVEDVASQSHLLGLNAAIEAARSGEHGRGFSVVATEIRKMADRSKQSAEDIRSQLGAIATSVQSITHQSTQVTSKVNDNLLAINELKNAYDHIATTTENLASQL